MKSWSVNYTATELGASSEIAKVTNSLEWFLKAGGILVAVLLIIKAADRMRCGDAWGSLLSLVAATLLALAPYIAKIFHF